MRQLEEIHDLEEVHELEEVHDLEPLPEGREATRQMSWEAYKQALNPDTKPTAPPPSSVDEGDDPLSVRDAMLAAFLDDGPVEIRTEPPVAGRPTVKPEKA